MTDTARQQYDSGPKKIGAAGGRSVIDHAASTQSVIFNKENYEHKCKT